MLKNKHSLISKVASTIISVLCDHYLVLLISITATGLFLRFSGLNVTPLTFGEMAVTSLSRLPIPHLQDAIENGPILHPPFYYWIQHFFLMFGVTEFSIRFLPALCGTLSIPVTYLLGKEFHGKDTGILAAAIIAIFPYHIFCSQDGTPYSMMLLIILVSLVFFVHMIKTDSSACGACFGFFSGLASWVMYYSVILTFSLLLFELVEWKMGFRKRFDENRALYMGIIFFLFVIISLPGLVHDLKQIPGFMSFHGIPLGGPVILKALNQSYLLNKPLMIITMILLMIGIVGLFRYDYQLFSLLLFMIFVPTALGIVLSFWIPFDPQYILLILPAVCLGAGFSYTIIYSFLSRWIMISRLKVLVILLILFCALSLPLGF
jgi:mannosyltransferase